MGVESVLVVGLHTLEHAKSFLQEATGAHLQLWCLLDLIFMLFAILQHEADNRSHIGQTALHPNARLSALPGRLRCCVVADHIIARRDPLVLQEKRHGSTGRSWIAAAQHR